jgi:hypothetical protein
VDTDLEQVVAAVKEHLSEHPNAADTLEGIASWWLSTRYPSVPRSLVEQALTKLEDEAFVTARRVANGTVIYALNKKTP